MLCDGLTSYSTHSLVQGTKWIPCSHLPVHALRFLLPTRVKEGKDVCLDVIPTCSCSVALYRTGDLGGDTRTPTTDNQNLRKGLGPNLLRLSMPRKQSQSNIRMMVESGACKKYKRSFQSLAVIVLSQRQSQPAHYCSVFSNENKS